MTQLRALSRQWTILIVAFLVVGALFLWTLGRVHAAGTTYYVASNGNDVADGSSPATSFQHIQKCASIAQAGDTCLIAAGTYHETVTPQNSGTAAAPITFAPYNNAQVIIDGADAVTGWSAYAGAIYQASVTLPISGYQDSGFLANQVFSDSAMVNEARWPATGTDLGHPTEATAGANSSCSTTSVIYDTNLPGGNWVGATIHLRGGFDWTAQTGTVTAYTPGQSVSFTGADADCFDLGAKSGSKYYLTQGPLSSLNSPGEWYYDGAAHQLYLWLPSSDNPANHTIEAKQRNYAFDLSGRANITLTHLTLQAATVTTSDTSTYNTLNAVTATYPSHFVTLPPDNSVQSGCGIYCTHAYDSGIIFKGSHNTLQHSTVAYSAGNGVSLQGTYNTVTDTLIHDTDYSASYDSLINVIGTNETITHNTLYNTGRDGIQGPSGNETIAYNDIFHFGELNQDLGGIYTCCANINGTGTSIDHNWIHDNIAVGDRGFAYSAPGEGVYIDNGAHDFAVHHNVIWNIGDKDIFFHGNNGAGSSENNHAYNNTLGPGDPNSISISGAGTDYKGTSAINNIARGGIDTQSGVTYANNITSGTDPLFVYPGGVDYHLQSTSPARGAGQPISGITAAGNASPDAGAYEGADWTPGCSFIGCGNGKNLVNNPGFESNSLTGWCNDTSYCANASVVASNSHYGAYAAQVGGAGSDLEQIIFNLTPNTNYTLKGWGAVAVAGEQVWIGVSRGRPPHKTTPSRTTTSRTSSRLTKMVGASMHAVRWIPVARASTTIGFTTPLRALRRTACM